MNYSLFSQYQTFVDGVTSKASKLDPEFLNQFKRLQKQKSELTNPCVSRLMTAAIGLSGEIGETIECCFALNFDEQKLTDEVGDLMWYWMNYCIALGIDPDSVKIKACTSAPAFGINAVAPLAIKISAVTDLIKKLLFHGKEYTQENHNLLVRSADDLLNMINNLCLAYKLDLDNVVLRNIEKLSTRYPGGTFTVLRSEERII